MKSKAHVVRTSFVEVNVYSVIILSMPGTVLSFVTWSHLILHTVFFILRVLFPKQPFPALQPQSLLSLGSEAAGSVCCVVGSCESGSASHKGCEQTRTRTSQFETCRSSCTHTNTNTHAHRGSRVCVKGVICVAAGEAELS